MRANGLKHETTTTGTGPLTLTAVSGWPSYASAFGSTGTRMVDYVVQTAAGLPIEGGVGELALSTLILTRARVQWTWDGTTYDNTAPSALSLASGTHQVICGPTVETGGVYASSTTPGDNLGVMTGTFAGTGTTTLNLANQRCLFFWAPIISAGQVSKVSLRIVTGYTGGTSSLKVGLYDIDEAGKPFNLLADFGNLGALTSSTNMTSAALGTPISVPPGDMYAIALLPEFSGGSGTPTLMISQGTIGGSPFGCVLDNTGLVDRVILCMEVTGQTSLPADASGLTYAVTSTEMPFLVLG
jgi:hypothetical protein